MENELDAVQFCCLLWSREEWENIYTESINGDMYIYMRERKGILVYVSLITCSSYM